MVVRAAVSCGRWSAGANLMQLDAAAYAFNLVGDAGGEFLVELGGIRAHALDCRREVRTSIKRYEPESSGGGKRKKAAGQK